VPFALVTTGVCHQEWLTFIAFSESRELKRAIDSLAIAETKLPNDVFGSLRRDRKEDGREREHTATKSECKFDNQLRL